MKKQLFNYIVGVSTLLLVCYTTYDFYSKNKTINKDHNKEIFNQLKREYYKIETVKLQLTELEKTSLIIATYNKHKLVPTNNIISDSLNNILKIAPQDIICDIQDKKIKLSVMYEQFFTNLIYAKEIFNIDIDEVSNSHIKYFPNFNFEIYEHSEPKYHIKIDSDVYIQSMRDELRRIESL